MSIIIKGVKMPKNEELWIRVQPDGNIVSQTGYIIKGASAKPVSQHGRLIDADALKLTFSDGINEDGVLYVPFRDIVKSIENAPTIIEAEEEDNGN